LTERKTVKVIRYKIKKLPVWSNDSGKSNEVSCQGLLMSHELKLIKDYEGDSVLIEQKYCK